MCDFHNVDWNYGRFSYGSFRLPSVRLRLESIRLRPVSQFAYVLNFVLWQSLTVDSPTWCAVSEFVNKRCHFLTVDSILFIRLAFNKWLGFALFKYFKIAYRN